MANNIPTGTDDPLISLSINQVFTFAPAAFGFHDADSADTLQKVQITTLPLAGSLTLNDGSTDVPVTLNQEILVADILANKLKFTPATDATGMAYATIGFKVSDGELYSTNANTLTFTVNNFGFENDFTNWTVNDATIGTGGNYTSGSNTWTVTPSGTKMAVLTPAPASSSEKGSVYAALEIGSTAQTYLDTQFPNPTNYSYVYTDLTLAANQKISMAWNQVATDYAPFNDASWVSFVNQTNTSDTSMLIKVGEYGNISGQVAILGATVLGSGNYITGDYGSTGWQTLSLTAGEAGTYRLGFTIFNLNDFVLNPYLFIDQQVGNTLKNGIPFDAVDIPIVAPTNNAPTLTQFSSPVANGNEDSVITVTFSNLTTYGNEADSTGSVTSFVVKTVTTGTLKIGVDFGSATPFVIGTNDTIDAMHNAYWTPAENANGTLNAFAVIAKDSSGSESSIPVQTPINVTAINDAPVLSAHNNLGVAYGKPWNFYGLFTDPENDTLTYNSTTTAQPAPNWIIVNNGSTITAPSKALNQTFPIHITATDTGNLSANADFTVTILNFDAGNLLVHEPSNSSSITNISGIDTASYSTQNYGINASLAATSSISGGSSNDVLKFHDSFVGLKNIIGSSHADRLEDSSSTSNSIFAGGLGNDLYIISNSTTKIIEDLNGGSDEVQSSTDYDLSKLRNIEALTLTGSAIKATGANKNEHLVGNSVNNILDGRAGHDIMEGGAGDDTYFVDNISDVIVETPPNGNDTVISSITSLNGYTLPENVENLTLIGKNSRSVMQGTGNELNNVITASSGGGTLKGMAGNDTLIGGIKSDKLVGGLGADSLVGGLGKNVYIYKVAGESNIGSFDHIVGTFNDDSADKIQLATTLSESDLNIIVAQNVGVAESGLTVSALNNFLNTTNGTATAKFQSSKLNVAIFNTTDSKTFFAIDIDGSATFTTSDMLIDVTGSTLTSVTADTFKRTAPVAPNAPAFTFAGHDNFSMTQSVSNSSSIVTVSGLEQGATWKYSLKNGAYVTGTGTSFELPPDTYVAHDIRVIQTNSSGIDSLDAFNSQPIYATVDYVTVTEANVTPYDTSTTAVRFQMMAFDTYTYGISGFGTGDSINFHYGSGSALTVVNSYSNDGVVDLTYTLNSQTITAHLTGLTTAQDAAIANNDIDSFRTVFGANSVTANNVAPSFNGTLNNSPISFSGSPIVLDSSVEIYDAELAALNRFNGVSYGDYVGATLTLQRFGGANSADVFDFDPNSNFELNNGIISGGDGTVMGTYTQSGGVLSITFIFDSYYNQSYADQSSINDLLSAITYQNTDAPTTGNAVIAWTFNDGNGGGTGGATTVTFVPSPSSTHTYLLSSSGTWDQVEAQAVALGGHLVTVNDANEDAWLVSQFGNSEAFWIGLNDAATEGTFVWASGESVTYTNWSANQPDNVASIENYATNNFNNGWNDVMGANSYRGIIELPFINSAPTVTNFNVSETYVEDTPLNLTDIVVIDSDSLNVTVTLTLSNIAAGSLTTATSGNVTSTYNLQTGVWAASGAIADVNALLAGLTFTPAANFNENFTVDTSVSDGLAPAVVTSKIFTGTAVNDTPTFSTSAAISIAHNSMITSSGDLTTTQPTLEADVYWDGTGVNPLLIYNGNPSNSGYGLLGIKNSTNNTLEIHLLIGGKQVDSTILGTIQANSWTHMGVSLATDNTTYNYAIGSTVGSITSSTPNPQDNTIHFGGTSNDSFSGKVDNVAVWNTQFTGAQIQGHSSGLIGNEANLAGLWKFENNLTNSVVGGHAFATTIGSTSFTSTFAISGIAMKNQTLTVDTNSISDIDGLGTFTYQWKANNTDISGATSSTLTLSQNEVGKTITVAVSYTDGGGTPETLTTLPTSIVQPTTVAVTAANTSYDASSDDIVFNFASGNYTYSISGFGAGDVLNFPIGNTPTVSNSNFSDGSVNVQWAANSQIITVHLTDLTAQQDAAIFGLSSFRTVFGAAAVNSSPVATNSSVTTNEDTPKVFAVSDFGYSDAEGTPMANVEILSLPELGLLTFNNGTSDVAVAVNQVITAADISAGKLKYTPPFNANGINYSNFSFAVSDGSLYSTATTMILNVTSYNPVTGHYYTLTTPTTWQGAETQAIAMGGHLVTINDATENAWLLSAFGNTEPFWIGFNDRITEGVFNWISGETITYTNWNSGEPNNTIYYSTGEDYAVINWGTNGKWVDLLANEAGTDSFDTARRGIIEIPVAGQTFTLTSAAENITGTAGDDTVNVPAFIATGTFALGLGTDTINAATGANISGLNLGAATTAESLVMAGTVTMTAPQYAGFSTITAAGASDHIVLTTQATGLTLNSSIETFTLGNFANAVTLAGTGQAVVGGTGADSIYSGAGSDSITGGAGSDLFNFGTNGSIVGISLDVITDYVSGTDLIRFGGSVTLLAADTSALAAGSNVQTNAVGLVNFHADDDTYTERIVAIQADSQLDAVGSVALFTSGSDSYIYYAGAATENADDQIIKLSGLTVTGLNITGGDISSVLASSANLLNVGTTSFDFSTDQTTNFSKSGSFFSWSSGNGAITIPSQSDEIWTLNQAAPVTANNGTYTVSAFVHNSANSGYASLGFTTNSSNSNTGGIASPSVNNFLGVSFHGGGGNFLNNGTINTNLAHTELVIGNWYKVVFSATETNNSTFDLAFDIYNASSSSVVGSSLFHTTTTVNNSDIATSMGLYPYFSNEGSRLDSLDNFEISLVGV